MRQRYPELDIEHYTCDAGEQLIQPVQMLAIKEEYIKCTTRNAQKIKSPYLLDLLGDAEGEGCAACFV